ncbi:MAG: 4Fe-4S binding protein [Bacteroidales bacterium]|nr:4Fe-4S binding protein [Bacteroidales bacterium]
MEETFHHALKFKTDLCIGCSHCTGVCPTGAIHVEGGHPVLEPNRCIDCGHCYQACPVNAIYIEQDDFQTIYNYACPVILLPSTFSAQFPEKISQRAILSAIYHLGFKYIYEVEKSVDVLHEVICERIKDRDVEHPVISTFCPAVVRLIQVKFPSLIPNLLLVRPPMDITSLYIRKNLTDRGVPPEDIGIFYVAPCAAKIAAIKSPVGETKAQTDGVINMNYLYNKVFRVIKQGEYQLRDDEFDFHPISRRSLLWTMTGGEINDLPQGRNLAIDDIDNVSEFLEKVENGDVEGVDYLELRACDESCAGGILCGSNRFLVAERQKKRAAQKSVKVSPKENRLLTYKEYLKDNISVGKVEPRSMDKLDEDIGVAMRKMKKSFELNSNLPQVDCRICGYQSCKALSDAVVNGQADIRQCIFVQRIMELTDKMSTAESIRLQRNIWGDQKLDKDSLKGMAINEL